MRRHEAGTPWKANLRVDHRILHIKSSFFAPGEEAVDAPRDQCEDCWRSWVAKVVAKELGDQPDTPGEGQ
jgi:hypothetical protein